MKSLNHTTRRAMSRELRAALLASSAGLAAVGFAAPALAQDAPASVSGQTSTATVSKDEIVVTGSRIARKDYTATSPTVTVDEKLLQNSSNIALEANLNKLPQFSPALTQFATDDIQSSANTTLGASTVSLRQLGSNRNLVLIDGRRPTPVNGSGVVDINSIPSAAVDRVEIITGGASSTYGADAVGGVVNFILKRNYQGLTLDGQYGITQKGDGAEWRLSSLIGANFADGRGNVLMGVERYQRNIVLRADRQAYQKLWSSNTTGGTDFFVPQNYAAPGPTTMYSQGSLDSYFAKFGAVPGTIPVNASMYLNDDNGTLFTNQSIGNGATYRPLFFGYTGQIDGLHRKVNGTGLLVSNNVEELLSSSQTRWSFFAKGRYDFSDDISFFTQAMFTKTTLPSVSQFAPAINGWGTLIPHGSGLYTGNASLGIPSSINPDGTPNDNSDNPTNVNYLAGGKFGLSCPLTGGCTNSMVFPTPAGLSSILDQRQTAIFGVVPTGPAGSGMNEPWTANLFLKQLGERKTINFNQSYQIVAGFNGRVPGTDFTWEVFGSHGETVSKTNQLNFGSVQRIRAVLTAPNYGKNFSTQGNLGQPGNGFQGATASCTTGISPFSTAAWSADCKAAITTNTQNENRIQQTVWEGNVQGGLFALPYGDLRFAVGAAYRSNSIQFAADSSATQGASFLEGVVGIFPQGNTVGTTEVSELYGELLIPLLADLPFAKAVDLELGYRYSDYSSVGTVGTWKANAVWQVFDEFSFRGGYQKATRAPNLGELYTAATSTLGIAFDGDPCSRANPAAPVGIGNYSANPTANPTNAAAVELLCRQLMGPTAAGAYYQATQSNATFGFSFPTLIGNPNLESEEATTWTVGAVVRSPFTSPWLARLRGSVDYYNVVLANGISQQSIDGTYRRCFAKVYNPAMTLNEFCGLITRDPSTGAASNVRVTYSNGGRVETSGFDLQLDWGVTFDEGGIPLPGTFSANVLFNYLDHFKTTADAAVQPLLDYAGTTGGGEVGTSPNSYRWKLFSTFTYSVGPLSASFQWQHLPPIDNLCKVTNSNCLVNGIPKYNMYNLSGSVAVTRDITLRFGIDNIFDIQPPYSGVNPAAVLPSLTGGSIASGQYDVLGRRFYIGARARF